MVKAIVGANWGDEGKVKITDMFAEKSDVVVRFQGGANAGHTIICDYGKFALHMLPSGVFYSHITNILGNGVALNIPFLVKELKSLEDGGVPAPKLLVSDRAQVVMPYHILLDEYEEERLGGKSFGSTKSGIAPCYSDKYSKIGFQVHVKLQDSVGGEERLAYGDSLVGRVVKGSLEPLGGRRDCRIHGVGHYVICKRSHSLGTHRISLICHGGRAYLMLLKRFLHFLHVLKKSYIVGKFMGGLSDA